MSKSKELEELEKLESALQSEDPGPHEGGDAPAADEAGAAAPEPPEADRKKQKVKLKKSVVDRIRVLNDSGALSEPLRLGAVAAPLAALDEAEALRILDALAGDVLGPGEEPTAWVRRQATKPSASAAEPPRAGAAKAAGATGDTAGSAPAKKATVKLSKSVALKIRELNEGGGLAAPIRVGLVAGGLADIKEADALEILSKLAEQDRKSVSNPSAWICKAVKEQVAKAEEQAAKAAAKAAEDEQWWSEWEKEQLRLGGEFAEALPEAVKARISELNRSEKLADVIRIGACAGALSLLPVKAALAVLKEVEKRADKIEHPSAWIASTAQHKAGAVMRRVDLLNRGSSGRPDLLKPISPERVRGPLSMLSEKDALAVLQEFEDQALNSADPSAWIITAAEGRTGEIVKQLQKINKSRAFKEPVKIGDALQALSQIEERDALGIVKKLWWQAAKIKWPTYWLISQAKWYQSWYRSKQGDAAPKQSKAEAKDGEADTESAAKESAQPETQNAGDAPAASRKVAEVPPGEAAPELAEEQQEPELDPEEEELAAWRELRDAFGDEPPSGEAVIAGEACQPTKKRANQDAPEGRQPKAPKVEDVGGGDGEDDYEAPVDDGEYEGDDVALVDDGEYETL